MLEASLTTSNAGIARKIRFPDGLRATRIARPG
jgi:hypothetical protein